MSNEKIFSYLGAAANALVIGQVAGGLLTTAAPFLVNGAANLSIGHWSQVIISIGLIIVYDGIIRAFRYARDLNASDNPNIKIHNVERLCDVISKEYYMYYNKILISARQKGQYKFRYPIKWTGDGEIFVECRTKNVSADLKDARHLAYTHDVVELIFENEIPRGEPITVEFVIHAKGNVRPQRPFYAVNMARHLPRNDMVLKVRFSEDVNVDDIRVLLFENPQCISHFKERKIDQLPMDRTVEFGQGLRVPQRECVTWAFADSAAAE